MMYERHKINRLIEYKDEITNQQIKNDIEWIIEAYNEYFVDSKEYEQEKKNYKSILNKYYNSEEEKAILKEQFIILNRKYKTLKDSCKNLKNMI